MAKVEGSNPFIRFMQSPWISGGFGFCAFWVGWDEGFWSVDSRSG
jgi:hypothetical protein